MNNILALVFLSQFFISGQANTHGRVSLRSFASEEARHPTILAKRQTSAGVDPQQEQTMTCHISKRYTAAEGKASDCFAAIDYLYNALPPRPSCVICRTCAVKPLDGLENPVGGNNGNAPNISQGSINAAYNSRFTDKVYSDNEPDCVNYVFPTAYHLDTPPPERTFWAPYLLGYPDGQGNLPRACSPALDDELMKYGG